MRSPSISSAAELATGSQASTGPVGRWVGSFLRSWLGVAILLLAFSTLMVGTNVAKSPQISPLDEYVYLDYLSKVPSQGFVRSGEETGALARQEIACRGVLGYGGRGYYGDSCNGRSFDSDPLYPYNGLTGADIYAPVYFAVTWLVAQPLVAVGVGLLDAGRWVNALWLWTGSIALWGLLRSLGTRPELALGLVMLALSTPAMFWATTYVSTDAPSLAVSAALAWVAVRIYKGRISPFWLPILSAVAVLFKVQNLALVGLVAGSLLVVSAVDLRRVGPTQSTWWAKLFRDRVVWASILSVVAGVAAQAGWLAFRAVQSVPEGGVSSIPTSQAPLTLRALFAESVRFVGGVGASGPSDVSADLMGVLVVYALSGLTVASILGVLLSPRRFRAPVVVISAVTLLIALATGPALVLATYASVGHYIPLPARYGIVLLPVFLVCIAMYLGSWGRRGSIAILVLGIASAVVALLT
ncbi:MAG: hypothetical protein H7288_09130 [Kineosporiaceae bacterium]|nr:hypothetical protein [Aeromicrobium sp.]